jgi:large subunit ribosomal protein L18
MTLYKNNFDRRRQRIRRKLKKNSIGLLRLTVFKSNNNIYAQIIDDKKGMTIVSASTLDSVVLKALEDKGKKSANVNAANAVGLSIGQKALEKGITSIVFDRSGYKYHGKVKALADAAREAGLKF